mmetsp:Transcript_31083/g.89868  ORF Transcript_31083/g.89868 Transcript_31083/m.89868 type:complete len:358 (+) Transcript_31083:410-1483(+)
MPHGRPPGNSYSPESCLTTNNLPLRTTAHRASATTASWRPYSQFSGRAVAPSAAECNSSRDRVAAVNPLSPPAACGRRGPVANPQGGGQYSGCSRCTAAWKASRGESRESPMYCSGKRLSPSSCTQVANLWHTSPFTVDAHGAASPLELAPAPNERRSARLPSRSSACDAERREASVAASAMSRSIREFSASRAVVALATLRAASPVAARTPMLVTVWASSWPPARTEPATTAAMPAEKATARVTTTNTMNIRAGNGFAANGTTSFCLHKWFGKHPGRRTDGGDCSSTARRSSRAVSVKRDPRFQMSGGCPARPVTPARARAAAADMVLHPSLFLLTALSCSQGMGLHKTKPNAASP